MKPDGSRHHPESPGTWTGSRLLQLREFRALSFQKKLEVLEMMREVTDRLLAARQRRVQKNLTVDPPQKS